VRGRGLRRRGGLGGFEARAGVGEKIVGVGSGRRRGVDGKDEEPILVLKRWEYGGKRNERLNEKNRFEAGKYRSKNERELGARDGFSGLL